MTKRISNHAKVNNLQNRINAMPGMGTLVNVNYCSVFSEIILTGDGMLVIKGILSNDGSRIKITKCPGFLRRLEGKPPVGGKPDRDPAINDMITAPPISFAKFASVCFKYKKAWSFIPSTY